MTKTAPILRMAGKQSGTALLQMAAGNILTAVAFGLFILPQGFASAGVTGFASVLCGYTPFSLSQLVLAINVLCLALGLVYLGKEFAAKTVASSLAFPLLLQVFTWMDVRPYGSPLLNAVLAGVFLGIGTGLLLRSGASSGGFSVPAVLLQKKLRIPVSLTMGITDATVILLQACGQPLSCTVYGILVITISALVVNKITTAHSLMIRHGRRAVSA